MLSLSLFSPPVLVIGSSLEDIFLVPQKPIRTLCQKEVCVQNLIAFELGAKIDLEKTITFCGGSAHNVAIGLSRRGIKAAVLSVLGHDPAGQKIIQSLRKEKVSTSLLQIRKSILTDQSFIILDPQTRERTIFSNKQTDIFLRLPSLRRFHYIYIASLKNKWREKLVAITKWGEYKKNNLQKYGLFFNPARAQIEKGVNHPTIKKILTLTTVLFLNEDESLEFLRLPKKLNPITIARKLTHLGPEIVVITRGAKGVVVANKNTSRAFSLPSKKARVVDVTGSGDAFASGFLGSYLKDQDPKKAAAAGIKNAVSVLSFFGSTAGLLRK